MYALIIEYGSPSDPPPPAVRNAYRELLARQGGYRRRLELQADGFRRCADLCLFDTGEAAEAALASAARQQFVAAQPLCGNISVALVVQEGDPLGTPTIVLRRTGLTSPQGGQQGWRDTFRQTAPQVALW